MRTYKLLILLLIAGLTVACETEIPFNGEETKPVLSLDCMACTDSVLEVEITSSRFFLDNDNDFPSITNATVALYVNGNFQENMAHSYHGRYRSQYVAKEGDFIRMEASAPGFAPTWAETDFPKAVADLQIDSTIARTESKPYTLNYYTEDGFYRLDTLGMSYSYIYTYRIGFSNPKTEQNYYRLVASFQTTYNGYTQTNYLNNFDDIVFGTKNDNLDGIFTESEYDRYSIFSDELIDGKPHTIKIAYNREVIEYDEGNGYPSGKLPKKGYDPIPTATYQMVINLQSISKSYYLYLKSLKALEIADPFMSEKVQVYTNVQGGLGIVGTRTNEIRRFDLPK